MRTTLDISEELIKEAMHLSGAKTKSQAIRQALEQQVKQIKRKRILTAKGKIDLDADLDVLRSRG